MKSARVATSEVSYLEAPLNSTPIPGISPQEQALQFLLEHLESTASFLPTIIRGVAAMAGRPVLLHSAGSTQRTGLVIALLLDILGLDAEPIVADYVQVEEDELAKLRRRQMGSQQMGEGYVLPGTSSKDEGARDYAIRTFLIELDSRYGGARGWARTRGISEALLDSLRSALLVSPRQ